jgi:hypothetical protein
VANAVEDALTPFGVTIRSLPITPERVWRWMRPGRRLFSQEAGTALGSALPHDIDPHEPEAS